MRTGLVALIGKPNVGKSTLLNRLVGHKVSIVSNQPQTTRRRVVGIVQGESHQIAFIDTPGIHEPHTKLGRAMVDAARTALSDIDLILYVADGSGRPGEMDKQIASLILPNPPAPIVLCLNKMDLLKADQVVPNVEAYCELFGTDVYMLTTATKGQNVDKLLDMVIERLPEGEPMWPEDEYTDQPSRFMVAELIRERILIATRQEVPHATAVTVEDWEELPSGHLRIGATIYVEKPGQRAILIGQKGQFIKKVGIEARGEIEELLERQVFLELHVKIREDWRMDPRMLRELQYTE